MITRDTREIRFITAPIKFRNFSRNKMNQRFNVLWLITLNELLTFPWQLAKSWTCSGSSSSENIKDKFHFKFRKTRWKFSFTSWWDLRKCVNLIVSNLKFPKSHTLTLINRSANIRIPENSRSQLYRLNFSVRHWNQWGEYLFPKSKNHNKNQIKRKSRKFCTGSRPSIIRSSILCPFAEGVREILKNCFLQ